MKIICIVPPSSLKERYGNFEDMGTLYPSLGLAYISAVGEESGNEVKVIDSEASGYSYSDIESFIREYHPDLIAMQTFCTNIQQVVKVADLAKKIDSNIKTALGGAQISQYPLDTLRKECIDFAVIGEGEVSFKDFLSALNKRKPLKYVKGLAWKKNGKVIFNKPQKLIKNIDGLPLPARHLFPMDKYHSSAQLRGKRTLNLMTSRGCPYRCAYCSGHLTFGSTYRYRSTEKVLEEIDQLTEKYKADGIQFYDETFTLNKKRVLELCAALSVRDKKIPWSCFTRVNLVDEELLQAMKKAGCYQIFYGIESGVQRLLNLIKKDITLDQAREAVRLTKKAKIEILASFMMGLPTETIKESYQTIDFAIELDPDYAQFPITTPYPGTELYDLALKHGKLITNDLTKFNSWDVVYVTNDRSPEELKRTVSIAYKRFYLRPKYILKRIIKLKDLPFHNIMKLTKSGVKVLINKAK